ncbi:hypothetical protein THRCLA_22624 [Thraustotheca clavata]|uniref:Tc1-like transposase DDE domain-containing protein n=1 Tax=Thraustotheca clavata TaxID=74557 RepID=A0A1V9YVQ9_9STRA|nr:hypothetical protein THRCLA_22624 [Thraustotheca clavata]
MVEELHNDIDLHGLSGVTFVMDNARYHRGKPTGTFKGSWSKELFCLTCLEYGIKVSPLN